MATRVMKTLVIGLGSTGTEICDAVYKRLRWQYGGIDNIPWVRFLCIETDENKGTLLRKDFMTITIEKHSFVDYKANPHQHEERMRLTKWLDKEALEDLKSDYVSGGAGNIRMIGRLAFFHNYDTIKREVNHRLQGLYNLRLDEVSRQMRSHGFESEIEFAAEGALRVFVVGSLTGGTCSGCAADMGFLVGRLLQNDRDAAYALLGMPIPGLSESDERLAERFKKNAWHALVEFNTYYAPGTTLPPIRYPGEATEVTADDVPYFATFLFQPEGTDKRDLNKLHGQIAESIYLNISSADVDPKAEKVDITRNHFCSQGLAVIEFPAQRVMEACSKRLLQETLDWWLGTAQEERVHAEIGVNWEWLLDHCTRTDGGENLRDDVSSRIQRACRSLRDLQIDKAEQEIHAIAEKFRGSGIVRTNVDNRVSSLPERLREVLHDKVPRALRELEYGGPHNVAGALRKISRFLKELEKPEGGESIGVDIERELSKLRRVRKSWLLWLMGLRRAAADPIVGRIQSALRSQYLEEEIPRLIRASVREKRVVPQCEGILSEFIRRLEALKDRARAHEKLLKKQWEELAKTEPAVRGYSLFKRAHNPTEDGTVNEEYQEVLKSHDPSPAKNFHQGKIVAMAEVLKKIGLTDSDFPRQGSSWLETQRAESDPPLDDRVAEPMLQHAATFFEKIKDEDVLKRWRMADNPEAKAEDLFRLSQPSVEVDASRATRGGATRPRERKLLLLPNSSDHRNKFEETVRQKMTHYRAGDSPDAHTVACIQQHLGLSLDAVLPVIGEGGIHTAQCSDFRVWHTRKDVDWQIPEVEVSRAVKQLRAKIACSLLLGILRLHNRAIEMDFDGAVEGKKTVRLPWHTREAAERVKSGRPDLQGQSLGNFEKVLEERITAHIRGAKSPEDVFVGLCKAFQERKAHQVPDYDAFARLIVSFCKEYPALDAARMKICKPTEDTRKNMWHNKDAPLPVKGVSAPEDAFYCEKCNEFMGSTEEELEAMLWTCRTCNNYHGQGE